MLKSMIGQIRPSECERQRVEENIRTISCVKCTLVPAPGKSKEVITLCVKARLGQRRKRMESCLSAKGMWDKRLGSNGSVRVRG